MEKRVTELSEKTNETEPKSVATAIPRDYENQMLEAFVQNPEKIEWYNNAFSKFNVNGVDKMAWVWSWWAFFGTFWFLLYRKAYLPALVLFIINILAAAVPLLGLIVWILTGGFASYFVYKTYKQKKNEIETKIVDFKKRIETMNELGGSNEWVVWVAAFLTAVWLFSFVTFVIFPIAIGLGGAR